MLKSVLKKHNKLYRHCMKNQGFTLVEMLVTLVLITIIISLTALGILAWQDWSRFNQQNEYAQTLFIAAQNQLSEFAVNGRLIEMQNSLAGGSVEEAHEDESRSRIFCAETKYGVNLTDQIGALVDGDGNAYDMALIFPESASKSDDKKELYRDEIVSLRAETGDYCAYLDNPMAFKDTDPEAFWVFELVGAYVYDTSILDGGDKGVASICVELTPEDGQVFAVLYSDRNKQFIYNVLEDPKGKEEADFISDISNRTEEYRRPRMVGYYGVDTLYASTINEMVRPSLASVKLINKDTFYLTAKLSPKYKAITSLLTYEIDLDASKDSNDKKLTMVLEGSKLRNEENTTEPIDCPMYRYDDAGEKVSIGTYPIMAWVEKDATIHVIYDAADIQANTYRYENELDTIRSEEAEKASFAETMSFFRFGVDLDDVFATVVAKADGYTDSKPASNFGNLNPLKNQTGKNPCYASIEKTVNGEATDYKYTLVNARHFYNVRYVEDISYEKEAKGYKNVAKIGNVSFQLKNDIDFAQFQADGNLYNSNVTKSKIDLSQLDGKIYTLSGKEIAQVTRFNCEFPTFKQLRMNDRFDGANKIIKGVSSSEISNVLYMIYTKGELSTEDDTLPLTTCRPIGLFNVSYGAIQNLSMDNFSIKGSDMVGAFCGVNAGNLDKITTLNTNKLSQVSGVKNVGGIMGFQLMTGIHAEVKGLTNRAGVYGSEAVGGIVGMIRNEFSDFDFSEFDLTVAQMNNLIQDSEKTVTVKECTNYGPVFGYKQSDLKGVYSKKKAATDGMPEDNPEKIRYIGGIAGYCYNTDVDKTENIMIDNCISSPQYTGVELNSILSDSKKLEEKLVGDYVGGIAGYNYFGTIQNCSTKAEKGSTGCLFGYKYVGGIVGLNIGPASGIIGGNASDKGSNENHVVGRYYAGGITGANANVKAEAIAYDKTKVSSKDPEKLSEKDAILETSSERSMNVVIENWTNKGVVIATEEYAGGITGYNAGWIYKCYSEVSATNVDKYFKTFADHYDLGDYVGGIAGYNNGIIGNTKRNVITGKKTGTQGAIIAADVYVNGHDYVGGIVGYNDVDSIVEDYQVASGYVRGSAHKFKDNAKSCFVGGYAGLNSSVDLLMDVENEPKIAKFIYSNPNVVNGDYFVGGTIGGNMINTKNFNKGASIASNWLDISPQLGNGGKCHVTLNNITTETLDNIRLEIELPGGVTLNNIQNYSYTQNGNVIVVTQKSGQGISLAPNDSESITFHLKYNNDDLAEQFKQAVISAKIYFDNMPGEAKDILAQYKTDNFLGRLKGEEFVGGYIGYNLFIENDAKEDWVLKNAEGDKGAVYNLQKLIVEAFAKSDKVDTDKKVSLADKKAILDDLNGTLNVKIKESQSTILVSGKDQDSTKTEFGDIIGEIYVGGVLGYNDENTKMIIQNVENATPVVANSAIEYAKEQVVNGVPRTIDYNDNDFTYTYSYAGGIIGKISEKTVVDHCWNAYSGSVRTKGTYTGGICEINEGTIQNCDVTNFGSGVDDYFGGLCGLNKETGIIQLCNYNNKTVSGRNVVGGITAENFGKIKKITLVNPKINASAISSGTKDGVTGLYAGVNGETGKIELENDLVGVYVKSDGRYVGAVTGVNIGSVLNKKVNADNTDSNLQISGNMEGYYDVGSLIGLNKDKDTTHQVKNYTSNATIIASNGNAGGIIGENASNNTILYCVNDAVVSATVGNAGGITSVNHGVITNCYDYKAVSAPKGMCGGIVAYNGNSKNKDALIENCYVGSSSEVVFTSTMSVGAIAAKNYGIIQKNKLENVTSTNTGTIPHTSIGGMVGDNEITGRIYINNGFEDGKIIPGVQGCKAIATTNNCNVGGVAGTNDGLISKTTDEVSYALIGAQVQIKGADYASLGGVTGLNTGTVSYCQVDATINGDLGTETTGYGGIAGYNGYSTKAQYNTGKNRHSEDTGYKAQILNCTFDGYMRADGSAGNPANVGGMTGVNGYGGFISGCAIGVREKDITGENDSLTTKILSGDFDTYGKKFGATMHEVQDQDKNAYAYVGGIAGRNFAEVTACDMQAKYADTTIEVKSFAGSTGGVVGYQYEEATTCGYKDENGTIHWVSTPQTMRAEMMSGENDYGVGGIIGYDKSIKDIQYLKNYANVVNFVNMNVKTGGVIATLEQQKVAIVNVNNCENYGKIEGVKQVGGIFGRLKYCSVNMEDCANYGEVYATDGNVGGMVSRFYDIQDTFLYLTRCVNYGYLHIKGTSTSQYVGGLVGNLDSSKNINVFIYDCDNVGIVERDSNVAYPKVEPLTAVNNTVGDFVGNGANGVWYMEQCQNYNHSVTSNGFIGDSGKAKLKDCLDDSDGKTNSNRLSPILGTGVSSTSTNLTSSTVQNVYYLDKTSKNTQDVLSKDGGAYFSYNRYTNFDNFWNGRKYQILNNPSLFLQNPSPHTFLQQANNTKMEFHVAYDKDKCKGIDAFNIYFWNSKMDNTVSITTKYTVTATFTDKSGNTGSTVVEKNGVTNIMEDNKLVLKVPAGVDKDIVDIVIHVTGGTAYYHGFSYDVIANDDSVKEYACSYAADKTNTTFHIAELERTTAGKTLANSITAPNDVKNRIKTANDYLDLLLDKYQQLRFDRQTAGYPYNMEFSVNSGNGVSAFVFYPVNNNTNVNNSINKPNEIRTYYYDYVVTFTDENGNTVDVGGSRADGTAAVGYDGGHELWRTPAIVKVPDGFSNNITNIRLSLKNAAYTAPNEANVKDNQNNFYLLGFGFVPNGSDQIYKMSSGEGGTSFSLDTLEVLGEKRTTHDGLSGHGISASNALDEIIGLKFAKYEKLQFNRHDVDGTYAITFDVKRGENASGMNAFVFYPGNDNFSTTTDPIKIKTFYYDYDVVFVDTDGNMSEPVSGRNANGTAAVGYDSGETIDKVYSPIIAKVPSGFSKDITRVILTIGKTVYTTPENIAKGSQPTNVNNIYFRGFAWIPNGSTEIEPMCVGDLPATRPGEYEGFGNITKLYCDYSNKGGTADAPYVYTEYDHNTGFNMTNNDPAADYFFGDRDLYPVSGGKADGSDSRLNVYRDIHPKFTTFVQEQYITERKLDTPVPSVVDTNSMYKVTWAAIPGAYEYEVKYTVKDSEGNVVAQSPRTYTIGGGSTTYVLPSGHEEWLGCEVTFSVRAVNAYRYNPKDEAKKYDYDSDWGSANIIVKKVLPQPEVHLELTAGNNMVAVLDNREDFRLESGEGYMNCVVETDFNSVEKFHIHVADDFISEEAHYLTGHSITSDFVMTARALPTTETTDFYSESYQFYLRGHFVDNALLETTPQYPGNEANNKTTNNFVDFRGFYGTVADQMTYSIYYNVYSRDSFVKADIVAFDDDLGLEVSYSSMETHTAATSGSAYFTATLSDLPQKWFADDFKGEIVARSYMEKSQYGYTHYGHTVATDIRLDGTQEENMATLSTIQDPYYLIDDGSSVVQKNVGILDENNQLKPGYTLQVKYDSDGKKIYDIFYNASIELAKKATEGKDPNYVYYNFCVGYKQYKSDTTPITITNSGSTNLSIEKQSADINPQDYQETYMTRNVANGTQTAATWPTNNYNYKMQEIQPAPIIDEEFTDEIVDGHRSFTFTFDEFYKDVFCMTEGGNASKAGNKWYTKNTDMCMTRADASVVPTWAAFLQKSDFNNISNLNATDLNKKLRIMNSYYYTYLNASYRVDLLGTTLAGEEAVIATKDISGANYLEGQDITNTYMVGSTTVNAVYQRYNYQVTFTDTDEIWNNYSDFTVRVMRLGDKNNMIQSSGVAPTQAVKIASYSNSTFTLPRYSDYKIHVMMKLNTINNPTATLHQQDGEFVMDTLLYDLNYGAITNEDQLADLGGYLITAKVAVPSNPEDVAKTHYYYVKEFDESIADNDIAIDKDALEADGVLREIDKDTEYVINGNVRAAMIDLSDFNTGDDVEISVKAIASTKSINYVDGDEGNGCHVTISDRLTVPTIGLLTIDTAKGMNDKEAASALQTVDTETYKKGFYLQYGDDPNYSGDAYSTATMKMAVAVFDKGPGVDGNPAADDQSKMEVGDDKSGTWNEGAIITLYTKTKSTDSDVVSPLDMGYIKDHTSVQIDLISFEDYPGQYAGKWLKIALKAASPSRIASKWTDEDALDKATYMWIHIPNLQLDNVSIKDAQASADASNNITDVARYYVSNTNTWYNNKEDIPTTYQDMASEVYTQTIQLAEDNCVDGYRVNIVANDVSVSENNIDCSLPVTTIELRKHLTNPADASTFDGTMDVYVKDASFNKKDNDSFNTVSQSTKEEQFVGNISRTEEQIIDFVDFADLNDYANLLAEYSAVSLKTTAQIRFIPGKDGKNGIYQFILPDITAIGETSYCDDKTSFRNSQVLVEPYLNTVVNPVYVIGKAALWRRSETEVLVNDVPQTIYGTEISEMICDPTDDITAWFEAVKTILQNYHIS